MPNPWIVHLKAYALKNKITYKQAMQDPKSKYQYQAVKSSRLPSAPVEPPKPVSVRVPAKAKKFDMALAQRLVEPPASRVLRNTDLLRTIGAYTNPIPKNRLDTVAQARKKYPKIFKKPLYFRFGENMFLDEDEQEIEGDDERDDRFIEQLPYAIDTIFEMVYDEVRRPRLSVAVLEDLILGLLDGNEYHAEELTKKMVAGDPKKYY